MPPLFLKLEKDNALTRQPNLTKRKWSPADSQGKEGQRCCPCPSPADLGTSWSRVSSWIGLWSMHHTALMKSPLNKCSLGYWNTRFILSSSIAVSGWTLSLSWCRNQFSQRLVKFMGSHFPSSPVKWHPFISIGGTCNYLKGEFGWWAYWPCQALQMHVYILQPLFKKIACRMN